MLYLFCLYYYLFFFCIYRTSCYGILNHNIIIRVFNIFVLVVAASAADSAIKFPIPNRYDAKTKNNIDIDVISSILKPSIFRGRNEIADDVDEDSRTNTSI